MLSNSVNLLICKDADAVSVEAADRFTCAAIRTVAERPVFYTAISGGNTPRGMFELLAEPGYAKLVPWSCTHIFFTDERYVPQDSEDSNFKLANDLLFSKVPIPKENIHRFRTELSPEDAAKEYEKEMKAVMGDCPDFDLVVLGMGDDTHTASLFPESMALNEQEKWAASNYVEKLHSYRLTLTIPVLNCAREVLVLVTGKDKADALAVAFQETQDITAHPIHAIQPAYGKVIWIVDREAASKYQAGL